jgi:uncharacterized protein
MEPFTGNTRSLLVDPSAVPAPVSSEARVHSIDVLRGFALLGILAMNIQSFSMISAAYLNPTAYGDLTGANLWVWILSHVLADQKMYGIFSMLFGAGILLMTGRADASRGKSAGLHYRRMGWLLLFGVLHAHLFWYGDILYPYALCGMFVYLLRRKSPRTLFALAGLFMFIGSAIYLLIGWSMQFWPPAAVTAFAEDAWSPSADHVQAELAAYRGGWLAQMPWRSEEALFMQTLLFVFVFVWKTVANMLLGMALLKSGVLTAHRSRAFYTRLSLAGFATGLTVVSLGVWKNFAAGWDVRYSFFFGSQYNYWGSIAVDMGWIGLWMLVCMSSGFVWLKESLSAVGRTAFSNYILQTLIATTLFYGHGFGLFGSVSRLGQILICAVIWALQLVIAPIWLRHFEYGPMEWLWRSLTYRQKMPMRVQRGVLVENFK